MAIFIHRRRCDVTSDYPDVTSHARGVYLHIQNHVINQDIGTMLYQESILISDHCLLCHLFLGPPSASLVSGGPTINMCPRKSVSKVIAPWPLYYFNYY